MRRVNEGLQKERGGRRSLEKWKVGYLLIKNEKRLLRYWRITLMSE